MLALIMLGGCGRSENREGTPARSAAAPTANADGAVVHVINSDDKMRFDIARLEVTAGDRLVVELRNTGKMPKEAMGHNWVLLRKDADVQAYVNAAVVARTTEYLPAALSDQVVAATKLLGPGQRERVTFTAPTEPGNYVYLCTFPGHFGAGMRGVLVVNAAEAVTASENEEEVAP